MHAKIKLEINDKSHKRKINYNLKKNQGNNTKSSRNE